MMDAGTDLGEVPAGNYARILRKKLGSLEKFGPGGGVGRCGGGAPQDSVKSSSLAITINTNIILIFNE